MNYNYEQISTTTQLIIDAVSGAVIGVRHGSSGKSLFPAIPIVDINGIVTGLTGPSGAISIGGGGVNSIAYTSTIPLTVAGESYMPQQTVTSAIAFTAAASPVQGSLVYLRVVADGVHVPTFTPFLEWGGSQGYNNTSGIVNQLQFFYDGNDYWFTASQAVNAVALTMTAPLATSSAVANVTPTIVNITMSKGMDGAFIPAASAFTVTGHTVLTVGISGSTINLTLSAAFVNGEAARTVSYTQPGTNNARDTIGNLLLANFTGLAIANNVVAAASAVSMSGPSSGINGAASTNFSVGVTPLGGTITGTVVVTPSDSAGGGTFTPTTVSLTSGSPTATFTYTPGSTGAKTISTTNSSGLTNPANLIYTSTASATAPSAPTMGTAVQTGSTTANVPFTVGSDGGSAITSTVVTAYISGVSTGITGTNTGAGSGTVTMTSLTAATSYTFRAHSINTVNTGADSIDSNGITTAATATFAAWNPADKGPHITLSAGNLTTTGVTGIASAEGVRATVGKSAGKWYWELKGTATFGDVSEGIGKLTDTLNTIVGFSTTSYGYYSNSGLKYNNSAGTAYSSTFAVNDVIGIALDMDAGTLTYYKNNVSLGAAFTGLAGTFYPMLSCDTVNTTITANFGATALTYTQPAGFNAGLF